MTPDRPVGAYGLTFTGVDGRALVPTPRDSVWPLVQVTTSVRADSTPAGRRIGPDSAELPLVDESWIFLDRESGRATVAGGSATPDELLHPLLATAAVVFAWWHGRSAFHGGAFASAGRAWALLGDRGAGKSSTLAALAAAGVGVVTDDLLVVDGSNVFAGPRVLDLRPDMASELNASALTVRAGARHRLELSQVPAELPLAGWVFLNWGRQTTLRRVAPGEWLERATANLNTVTERAPSLLGLAGLEAWELSRPRDLASLQPAVEKLRALVER